MWCPEGYLTFGELMHVMDFDTYDVLVGAANRPPPDDPDDELLAHDGTLWPDDREHEAYHNWLVISLIEACRKNIPGAPFVLDSHSVIMAPPVDALADLVPLIPADEILLFAGRLVTGARKRRKQPRYAEVNAARLRLARLCIDHALAEWPAVQVAPDA